VATLLVQAGTVKVCFGGAEAARAEGGHGVPGAAPKKAGWPRLRSWPPCCPAGRRGWNGRCMDDVAGAQHE